MERLSVIIPALDEEQSISPIIARTLRALRAGGIPCEVVVVDDGSRDRTAAAARQAGARVVRHARRQGYGAALMTGIRRARHSLVCFLDADGSYPPEELLKLYHAARAGRDMVVGSRLATGATGMPAARKLGNRAFAWLARRRTGMPITDLTSGMRVLRRALVTTIRNPTPDLDFSAQLSLQLARRGIRYHEVPIRYDRRTGRSKLIPLKHGAKILWRILEA